MRVRKPSLPVLLIAIVFGALCGLLMATLALRTRTARQERVRLREEAGIVAQIRSMHEYYLKRDRPAP